MEYTFRNSAREEACTVSLSEFSLTLKQGKELRVVPYANIVEVQIERKGSRLFRIRLYPDSGRPIEISNRLYKGSAEADHSRTYATFVRVLHFHLKDKSNAGFISGKRSAQLGLEAMLVITFSFSISFVADYLGLSFINPFMQGAILSLCAGAFVLVANFNHWPRPYAPTNIPLDFLP